MKLQFKKEGRDGRGGKEEIVTNVAKFFKHQKRRCLNMTKNTIKKRIVIKEK
jgi:hypothetical protein